MENVHYRKKKQKLYNLNSESEESEVDSEYSRSPESYRKDLPYDFSNLDNETLNQIDHTRNRQLYAGVNDNIATLIIDEVKDSNTPPSLSEVSLPEKNKP